MWCAVGHWSPEKLKSIFREGAQKDYWSVRVTKELEFSKQENKKVEYYMDIIKFLSFYLFMF